MKREKLFKVLSCLALAAFAVFCVSGLFDLSWFIGDGEVSLAFAAAAGMVGPGDSIEGGVTHQKVEENTDLHDLDLDAVVVKVRPSETPMDTLMRELKNSRQTKSIQTGGWEVGTRDTEDKVTAALTGSSDVSDLSIGKKNMWIPDDTLLVPDVKGGDGKPLMLYILSKNNTAGTLNVIAANPVDGKIPAIPENAALLRLGNAKSETDAQTTPFSTLPVSRYNFCQIHMCQVEESVVESLAKKKVSMDFSTYKEQSMWDWKRAMEYTNLFGVASVMTNPESQKLVYTSDGLWNQIDKAWEFDGSKDFTRKDYVAMTKFIFGDNNGSERKILFAGDDLVERMSSVTEFQQQIDPRNVEIVHGIRFQRIVTNFGELLLKSHKLFRGSFADNALVLDMSYITKEVYEPLHTKELNLDESGQRRVIAHRMIEHYCLFAENLPTHCKIRKKSA
ncbi:MAG: DUF5309 family protein [Oscillibacter sp.]|nr:DUF5309 family protein [Oscillibacter sp.]